MPEPVIVQVTLLAIVIAPAKNKFLSELLIKPLDCQISKFLGSELLYHVKKSTNKDSIISAILGYASSQSQLSAPYIKLSDE